MTQAKCNTVLEKSWLPYLATELEKPYMMELQSFLVAEQQQGKIVYPANDRLFAAFNLTPFDQVKVVILGQDPYHGPKQAHGLCFSVPKGVKTPPSLLNIYKELQNDLGLEIPTHGCLEHWAEQGVLLLNSVLSVEQGHAASHQGQGWERFTDHVIAQLNAHHEGVVFMLWGAYAQRKGAIIDRQRHWVLESSHPSPLSAYRGFLGCQHFSQANAYLSRHGRMPIDWALTK